MKFKEHLTYFRERAHITKTGLAEKLNVSPTYIMHIESGHRPPPTVQKCQEIARILSLSPRDITEAAVSGYIHHRISDDHITARTANAILISLNTFLNFSARRNYLAVNPLRGMKHYDQDKKKAHRFLSKKEIDKLKECAREEIIWPMVATALYTGMRYNEIKNLCWEDINFQQGWIIVRKSKSKKFRNIPMPGKLKKILRPLKDQGPCFRCQNIRRIWKRIRKKAGLPGTGWHTLRHTYASHLVMNGVPIVAVSELLGHAAIETTMIYAHLSPAHLRNSVKKLNF